MRSGGNFHDFLVPSLDGAISLVQMYNVASLVSQQLDLNVARSLDELLDEHSAVTESSLGLGGGTLEVLFDILGTEEVVS